MIAFLTVLTLLSWAALWPMLRAPEYLPEVLTLPTFDVPVTTFDPRGMT